MISASIWLKDLMVGGYGRENKPCKSYGYRFSLHQNRKSALMLKYAIFLVVLISCNEKYSGDFLLQPPTGSSYQMTVTMEELNDTAVINSETMEFTLATKQKDSLNDFNFIVRKIETQQPATRIVPLENGGMMVQSTGMREILSTAAIQGNQGWYNIVPRIVNDSVLVTINRIGQIRMFTGYGQPSPSQRLIGLQARLKPGKPLVLPWAWAMSI